MWHLALTFKAPEILNHLYATSRDGIHWEKPRLDIVGPDNRFAPPSYAQGHAGVWLTVREDSDEANPDARYKGFIQHDPLYHLTSADGLRWKEVGVAARYTDDTTTAVWHPVRREYLKIGRFCPDGHSIALRLMMTCVGGQELAKGNSPWHLVMLPDGEDLAADADAQFYYMPAFPHGGMYVGLLGVYHAGPESGLSETELTWSRDGLEWHRFARGTPVLARGEAGSWDAGFQVVPCGPIEVGDELWLFYSAYTGSHHGPLGEGAIGLARLRADGFASLDADERGGDALTRAFALEGNALEINADAKGSVIVEVMGTSGETLTESEPFTGDACHHVVAWKGRRDLAALRGTEVRLLFRLRQARLYAFQVADQTDFDAAGRERARNHRPERDPWEE
ncbi:MAG: hypothetical protein V2A58_09390 [Planctomycetota bacterium]